MFSKLNGKDLRIALVYLDNYDFEGEKYHIQERGIGDISRLANEENFVLEVVPTPIRDENAAEAAARQIEEKDIDFLLMFIGTCPNGKAILPLLSRNWRTGIWSVPEPVGDGPMPLNSLLGANLAMAIGSEYLKRDITCKYFHGWPNDEEFKSRLGVTVRALRALKNLRGSKIGLVVGVAPGYYDFIVDWKVLNEIFGVTIKEIGYDEIKKYLQSASELDLSSQISLIESISPCSLSKASLRKAAAVDLGLKKLAEDYGFDAMALGCWPEFLEAYGAAPCSTVARLTQEGMPVACEGDVIGALDMLLLLGISANTPALMDLAAKDEKDESICLWHCGATAPVLAESRCSLQQVWWSLEFPEHEQQEKMGAIYDLELKDDTYTIYRGMRNGTKAFLASGKAITGKPSWTGGRGWLGGLSIGSRPSTAKDFVNTVMVRGVPHHLALISGNWTEELFEATAWAGIKVMGMIPYTEAFATPIRDENAAEAAARQIEEKDV